MRAPAGRSGPAPRGPGVGSGAQAASRQRCTTALCMSRCRTVTLCPAPRRQSASARANVGARCRPPGAAVRDDHPAGAGARGERGNRGDRGADQLRDAGCAQHRGANGLVVCGHVPQLRADVRVPEVVTQIDGQVRPGRRTVQVTKRDDLNNSHQNSSRSERGVYRLPSSPPVQHPAGARTDEGGN